MIELIFKKNPIKSVRIERVTTQDNKFIVPIYVSWICGPVGVMQYNKIKHINIGHADLMLVLTEAYCELRLAILVERLIQFDKRHIIY